jgi:hypothetical protein
VGRGVQRSLLGEGEGPLLQEKALMGEHLEPRGQVLYTPGTDYQQVNLKLSTAEGEQSPSWQPGLHWALSPK